MSDTAKFWDVRSDEDHVAMATLLAPLIVASQNRNFIGKESARAQTYAWRLSLADVPRPILEEAIDRLVNRGITWMPKPGDVKEECAKVMAEKRKAAAALFLDGCEHSSHFIEIDGKNERCDCWKRALAAAEAVGQQIALPLMSREDQQELGS
jgi:hypothetical protein